MVGWLTLSRVNMSYVMVVSVVGILLCISTKVSQLEAYNRVVVLAMRVVS